jgi:hypothetical protein
MRVAGEIASLAEIAALPRRSDQTEAIAPISTGLLNLAKIIRIPAMQKESVPILSYGDQGLLLPGLHPPA